MTDKTAPEDVEPGRRAAYWRANADDLGDPREPGTVANVVERVARGETVSGAPCPTFAPFIVQIAAADVAVAVEVDWDPDERRLTVRPAPVAASVEAGA